MDKVYMNVLHTRMKYFKSKPITELTVNEIHEYLALRKEILASMPEVSKKLNEVATAIRKAIKPQMDAMKKYMQEIKKNQE